MDHSKKPKGVRGLYSSPIRRTWSSKKNSAFQREKEMYKKKEMHKERRRMEKMGREIVLHLKTTETIKMKFSPVSRSYYCP